MKRVQSACLYQTLNFILDPNVPKEDAIKKVSYELEQYKNNIGTNIQILNEIKNSNGSVTLEVRKKVSGYSIGNYFN